ncbi:DUF4215 domain-containing protein, partial [Acidobacteriota bacterium]
LNSTGTGLIYSTYLGGSDADRGNGIAVNDLNQAFVAGFTLSTDFPVVPGAFQDTFAGAGEEDDYFVAHLSSDGDALGCGGSTYFGGERKESSYPNIAIDTSNNSLFISGTTHSDDFPIQDRFGVTGPAADVYRSVKPNPGDYDQPVAFRMSVPCICGDGIVDDEEECDDGNTDPTDECHECLFTYCGDVVVQNPNGTGTGGPNNDGFEECDDGNSDPADQCEDCTLTYCGDGVLQNPNGIGTGGPNNDGFEACDDGNSDPADQCEDCALTYCGDGVLQNPNGIGTGGPNNDGFEACDDGNSDPADQCEDCALTYCGDGVLQNPNGTGMGGPNNDGQEECDDGNTVPDDGCTNCTEDLPLSVTWAYYRATCAGEDILVEWGTRSETDTLGFVVERSDSQCGPYEAISSMIPARGPGYPYRYLDTGPLPTILNWYRIQEFATSGPGDRTEHFTTDEICDE